MRTCPLANHPHALSRYIKKVKNPVQKGRGLKSPNLARLLSTYPNLDVLEYSDA